MNWKQATSTPHFSPLSIGLIHFTGIGGIGMSGIAEILHNLGYKVQGSDLSDNANVKRLRDKGITVSVGHKAEMLGELMRLKWSVAVGGTHGKTTTTSIIATLFDTAGLDPTVINGGIINAYGTNARLGEGEWMVVEADESDGTFLRLPAHIAIATNVD